MTDLRADIEDELHGIDGLWVIIKEIGKCWQMGDDRIVVDAERDLFRVLQASGKRLRKNIKPERTCVAGPSSRSASAPDGVRRTAST
jgi:hypothetical protein